MAIGVDRRTTATADAILSIGRLICKLNIREIVTATSFEWRSQVRAPRCPEQRRKEEQSPILRPAKSWDSVVSSLDSICEK